MSQVVSLPLLLLEVLRLPLADGVLGVEAVLDVGLAVVLLAAWMSEILVGAAEGTGTALGMSPNNASICAWG